jgi:hypothetical protein
MSISIGFALNEHFSKDVVTEFTQAVKKIGYACLIGADAGEPDFAGGFKCFLREGPKFAQNWSFPTIGYIADREPEGNRLAYEIYEEFVGRECENTDVKFVHLMRSLAPLFGCSAARACFVFGSEFSTTDEVIYRHGSFSDFIKFLELPEFFTVRLWSPESRIIQEYYRFPVAFVVNGSAS